MIKIYKMSKKSWPNLSCESMNESASQTQYFNLKNNAGFVVFKKKQCLDVFAAKIVQFKKPSEKGAKVIFSLASQPVLQSETYFNLLKKLE